MAGAAEQQAEADDAVQHQHHGCENSVAGEHLAARLGRQHDGDDQGDLDDGDGDGQHDGAERLAASQPCTVQWQTVGGAGIGEVVVEYSANGGATWTFVDQVAGSGAYEWTVPAVDSETCLLRVRDGSRPQVYDVSDRPFSISRCLQKFQGDLNGDCCVDFADLAILLSEWLACGDPFDPAADPLP